jgi:MFS family permease
VWRVLALHALALVLLQSTLTCVTGLLPVIAKKTFEAGDFKTTVITSAPNILVLVSIFWGAWFPRVRVFSYVLTYMIVGLVPLALCALAHDPITLAGLAIIAAAGNAGWTPIAADLLRKHYPASMHGKIYATLVASTSAFAAAGSFGLGEWLRADAEAFRVYMPIAAGLQVMGAALIIVLLGGWKPPDADARGKRSLLGRLAGLSPASVKAGLYNSAIRPVLHMGEVLKADRVFARYEMAFMTYGIGWMVGWALVPLLVTNKLKLEYDQIAHSTQMTFLIAQVAMTLPAGLMVDRLGPMRTCRIAFALYALWPVALILAGGEASMAVASAIFGVSSAMVNMGWMLGPVSLAPTRDKVTQYIAIHTTLVGLRGTVGQFAGLAIYNLTGSFTIPLVIASVAFISASAQMASLHRLVVKKRQERRGGDPEPADA